MFTNRRVFIQHSLIFVPFCCDFSIPIGSPLCPLHCVSQEQTEFTITSSSPIWLGTLEGDFGMCWCSVQIPFHYSIKLTGKHGSFGGVEKAFLQAGRQGDFCLRKSAEFQIRQKLKQLRAQRRHATDLDKPKTCPSRFANSSPRSVDWKAKHVNALLGTPANWKIVGFMPWRIRADSPRDEEKMESC